MEQGNRSCKEYGALKLDLTKAYDHIHWRYLEDVLLRLGFHQKWMQWIMARGTIVRYSVIFNNVALEPLMPSCGLRQGDPLSHYFFLFVADGLSKLIQKQVHQRNIQEMCICRQARVSRICYLQMILYCSSQRPRIKHSRLSACCKPMRKVSVSW
jgi:hypothetical protein